MRVPTLVAHVKVPRLTVEGRLTWVVDTGADNTIVPAEALQRLGALPWEIAQLPTRPLTGVGGGATGCVVGAQLLVWDQTAWAVYDFNMVILMSPVLVGMEPLLGRDLLEHWAMSYNQPARTLTFQERRQRT